MVLDGDVAHARERFEDRPVDRLVEEEITRYLSRWKDSPEVREIYREPGEGLKDVVRCLVGEILPENPETYRVRHPGQPLRISTVVPEDRQHLIRAALTKLGAD